MKYVGERVRRVEDPRLVQGQGQYVGDLSFPGMLHAGFVRSPYAHARILSVDLSAVQALRDVVAAHTADDLPELSWPTDAAPIPPGIKGHGFFPLAKETVRYVGEPVAVVLVEDSQLLEDAIEAVEIEYEPLDPVADVEAAMNGGPQVWNDVPGNGAVDLTQGFGEIDEAFHGADVVVEERFEFPRSAPAAMEPRAVAAVPGGEGHVRLTLWDGTQAPHNARDSIARYLGLEADAVRVIVPDVGGGFGPRGRVYPEEYVVAVLALHHERPVRFVATRTEDLVTTAHGRGQVHYARLAARSDGTILGLRDHIIQDAGAYTPSGVIVPLNTARHLMGPYRMPALEVRITGVYTTRVISSPLRGGGRPQGIYVIERLMDRLAARLGLDRAEIRRRNFLQPDEFPYDTGMPAMGGTTVVYDSGNYPAYLQRALEAIGYDDFRREQKEAQEEGRYLGLGLVAFIESTGGGSEGARVTIREDGTVAVAVGSPSNGQGHATTFAQMAAERVGASIDTVYVTSGDTGAFPWGTGTFGSRMGQYGGNAVSLAARSVQERALQLAADLLEISPHDLDMADGRITVRGVPQPSLSLAQVAQEAVARGETLEESRSFQPSPGSTYAGGVNAAVVEVDVETGHVSILRYLVIHDSGTIVNPMVVEGQVHGGVAHGIGNALYEAFVYGEDGQPATATLADYSIPGAGDVPEIEIIHFETPSPFNPEGIKGAGEGGTIAAIPTLVSAVEDALSPFGIEINDVPMQTEMIALAVARARLSDT